MSVGTLLIRRWQLLAVTALLVVALGASSAAAADTSTTGPTVTLDPGEVEPDDYISLSIQGFTATYVIISVCGNEARQGSSDCNLPGSEGLRIDNLETGGPTLDRIPIAVPPTDCPCVIRVSSRDTGEIAIAPIVITGHPVSPVKDPTSLGNPIDVAIKATPKPKGMIETLRSGLGGPTRYEVTVTVRNHSVVPLRNVKVYGSAGREADNNLAQLDLTDPGPLAAGQTWRQTVSVMVPAPSFGDVEWKLTASGAGPTVTATSSTNHRPILLIVIVLILAADIAFLLIRLLVRRHATKANRPNSAGDGADRGAEDEGEPIDVDSRELVDAPS